MKQIPARLSDIMMIPVTLLAIIGLGSLTDFEFDSTCHDVFIYKEFGSLTQGF
jgi:hypothetical protein